MPEQATNVANDAPAKATVEGTQSENSPPAAQPAAPQPPQQNPNTFASLVNGVVVDNAAFEKEQEKIAPAAQNYIIFFTPRSGSSWLTSILSSTNLLGYPEEYINPRFLPVIIKNTNATTQSGLLSSLRRRRKSRNGVFGIEAISTDIRLFGITEFFDCFDRNTIIYNLWRDNLVAQGISLYRAVDTQHFHSTDKTERATPVYDAAKIKGWIIHILNIENDNFTILKQRELFARVLRYEDIIRHRNTTLAIFADALRVDLSEPDLANVGKAELQKVGDDWNKMAEERFRIEERDFVYSLDSQRLIKRDQT